VSVTRRIGSVLLAAAAIAVLAAAGAWGWFRYAVSSDRSLPASETTLVIPRGATASDVANVLHEKGVVGSPAAFNLLARIRREQGAMKAGQFRFPAHQSTEDVLEEIVSGGSQVAVWVTIPEGFTAREIAHELADRSLGTEDGFFDYFMGHSLELPGSRTTTLEGVLFPSTYLIPTGAAPADVARIFTDEFLRRLPPDAERKAKGLGLNVVQVVTLASLIEREAKADDERRLMAGVYYNRLRIGMPLEVDATIEYTFAHHKDVITQADLARDSPYNTYKQTGLPPTPIANPGRPSLLAAFDPEPSQYLFYVYKGDGHHAFSRTLAEHNANVARYLH
jgi:UPF0755 protein